MRISIIAALAFACVFACAALALAVACATPAQAKDETPLADEPRLVQMAESPYQWTGIAVSRKGRVFVNFPRWSPSIPMSVGEVDSAGKVRPYPNEKLNSWLLGEDPKGKFVCVQSVYVDAKDRLWILDAANPMFGGVVEGGPKLIHIDLKNNKVLRTFYFDDEIAPAASYLNDVRIDTKNETAFITDSGMGAIIVLDLASGASRRVLDDHPSTRAEEITFTVQNRPVAMKVNSDGIALDENDGWLYYQALTGRTLYRIPAKALRETLRDEPFDPVKLGERVKVVAKSGVSDGLLYTKRGILVSALEENAIKRVDSKGRVETVIWDPRISWPDSFAEGPDGSLWFTTSQIHLGPNPPTPYRIFRIPPWKED
jgi:sugar lactone lactonase YvrE